MKKTLSLALATTLMIQSSFAFSDLTNTHWAYNNVMAIQEKGIVSGFNDGTFKPDMELTREQFITMLVNALPGLRYHKSIKDLQAVLENTSKEESDFTDIDNRWSTEYIKTAGYCLVDEKDSTFNPSEAVLREDVAMGIVKAKGLENSEYDITILNTFSDLNNISENRKKYVAIAVKNGFMSGNANGTFNPKKALTRAEGASVIYNLLNKQTIEITDEMAEIIADTILEYQKNNISIAKQVDELIKTYNLSLEELNSLKDEIMNNNRNVIKINNLLLQKEITATNEELENAIRLICIPNLTNTQINMQIKADTMIANQIIKALKIWMIDYQEEISNNLILYSDIKNFAPEYCDKDYTAKAYKTGEGYYYVKIDKNKILIIVASSKEEAEKSINKKYSEERVGVIQEIEI